MSSKFSSGHFNNTNGAPREALQDLLKIDPDEPTATVWYHISPTAQNYPETEIPRSFEVRTPSEAYWTHGNATEHMNEAVIALKKVAGLEQSNPSLFSQFILYDYRKALSNATKGGMRYNRLVKSGNWTFKLSEKRSRPTSRRRARDVHGIEIGDSAMTTTIKSGTMSSSFIREDYFPAVIAYGPSTDCCRHVVFEKDDTDALELCLDMESDELLKIVLVLCNTFACVDESMTAPIADDAAICFDLPRVTSCNTFKTTVYRNGLHVVLNTTNSNSHAKAGNVVFGLGADGEISEIFVCDLSRDDIAHVKRELLA